MYSSNPTGVVKSPPLSPAYPYGQPTAAGIPVQYSNAPPAAWSTGLCDCFSDSRNCCVTCLCPCITFGQIAHTVDEGATSCRTSGAIYALLALLSGCGCMLYSCFYRSKMRQRFMLEKSPCEDCLVHCCCELCALCQEHRQLRILGFNMSHGNVERQNGGVAMAPILQGGMTRS